MDALLCRLHAWIAPCPLFARFTLMTRIALAGGFVMPGMIKLLGRRFTTLPTSNPVGAFFEAMYQTGFYWNFLGFAQVLAAILIVIPRTSLLGAMIFHGIAVNIFLITVSVGFTGTWIITGLMLLATIWLLFWDYPRLRPLFGLAGGPEPAPTNVGLGPVAYLAAFLAIPGAFYAMVLGAYLPGVPRASLALSLGCVAIGMSVLYVPVAVALWRERRFPFRFLAAG